MSNLAYELINGDCLKVLEKMEDNSVDAIVTDPPYGIEFMAKKWDYDVPSVEIWKECIRVLKHGGHLLSFAGSRTYHRMAVNIEDAGFEIRDQIMWIYGSGFPKSHNIGKAIDKAAGAEREVIGRNPNSREKCDKSNTLYESGTVGKTDFITKPTTPEAKQWEGWGTALKPAHEPIVVARKPFKGTVVENVLEHGTGALNIDGCRIDTGENLNGGGYSKGDYDTKDTIMKLGVKRLNGEYEQPTGRWPSNVIHDGSDEVVSLFPNSKGGGNDYEVGNVGYCFSVGERSKRPMAHGYNDDGSAARFFYCPKANKKERDLGLNDFEESKSRKWRDDKGMKYTGSGNLREEMSKNFHPTVKPVDLMKYLCRLITPPNGVVLDPFMGSGTTGIGATTQGFGFIGIEREEDYIEIARARITHWVDEHEETLREKRAQRSLFDW